MNIVLLYSEILRVEIYIQGEICSGEKKDEVLLRRRRGRDGSDAWVLG